MHIFCAMGRNSSKCLRISLFFNFQLNKSNMSRLTINNVAPNLTGKYNCEVSVELSFHTELVSGDMEVVGKSKK